MQYLLPWKSATDQLRDPAVDQGYRLRLAAARPGQHPACQVRDNEREEQPIKIRLGSA